jgi:hypothetical protein
VCVQGFYQLNNFNGLMAVVSGLRASAVSRLKHTVEEVPQKIRDVRGRLLFFLSCLACKAEMSRHAQVQTELEELMQTASSFKKYRMHLHSVNPPCIPFLCAPPPPPCASFSPC